MEMKVLFYITIIMVTASCNDSYNDKKPLRKLVDFSRKELYEELASRQLDSPVQTGDSSIFVSDTLKPIHYEELKTYTPLEIFNEIKIQETILYGVYGRDDRKEICDITDKKILKNATGVVAFFRKDQLTDNGDGTFSVKKYTLFKNTLEPALCDNEPFCLEPSICNCTGFAISQNIIASAGHCLEDSSDLKNWVFVFDYYMKNDTTPEVTFKKKDILHPRQLVKYMHDDITDEDFLLIKTNETIPASRLLKYDTAKTYLNMPVYVVGHPYGLPMKYAGNAIIRDNTPVNYFIANVDTYAGNSGSPVFSMKNHKVVGILVRGGEDFQELGGCQQSKICPDDSCRGEDVTRILTILRFLPKK